MRKGEEERGERRVKEEEGIEIINSSKGEERRRGDEERGARQGRVKENEGRGIMNRGEA